MCCLASWLTKTEGYHIVTLPIGLSDRLTQPPGKVLLGQGLSSHPIPEADEQLLLRLKYNWNILPKYPRVSLSSCSGGGSFLLTDHPDD